MFTFSMLVEKGLKSTDVEVIQEARAKAKGKVITTIKYLKNALANGNFLLDEIEKFVQAAYEKLDSRHNTFQELHERFCLFRTKEKDPIAEAEAKEREDSYSKQVSTEFFAMKRELMKFKKTEEKEAEDSARALEKETEDSARDLEKETEDSDRALEKETEGSAKALNVLLLADAADTDKKQLDVEKKVDKSEDINEAEDLNLKLESISIKLKTNIDESKTSKPRSSSSSVLIDRNNSTIIKPKETRSPKFSGYDRDFVQFKKDFIEIVMHPERSDVEIGYYLREAVPAKFKHLVSHIFYSDHEKMMQVLDKKFGPDRFKEFIENLTAETVLKKEDKQDKTVEDVTDDQNLVEKVTRNYKVVSCSEVNTKQDDWHHIPYKEKISDIPTRGETTDEGLENQLSINFKKHSPTYAAIVPVDNLIDIVKKDVEDPNVDRDSDVDSTEVENNEDNPDIAKKDVKDQDVHRDSDEDIIEVDDNYEKPDIAMEDVKVRDVDDKDFNEDNSEDGKPDMSRKDVKEQDVCRDSDNDSPEDEINDKKPDIDAKFTEDNKNRSHFTYEVSHTDKSDIDPGEVGAILSTFQGSDKAVPNIMPVAGRASRFCLLEIVMKIVGAPEYGDVSKYLITCKRLIIIYPKSLMKSIAIVTTVKDEPPKGGSDVVSFKMNFFSHSSYEANRTSIVSLYCDIAASTSSLMWVKLYLMKKVTSWVSSIGSSKVLMSDKPLAVMTRWFRKKLSNVRKLCFEDVKKEI